MSRHDSFSSVNEDIIGTATSVEDIISALAKRGCMDLTSSINMAACSNFPCAGGGFCDVYRGELDNGTRIAIKSLRVYDGPDVDKQRQKILKHAAKELYHWAKLRHSNILPLMGLALFRDHISMVSQWMDNGNLTSFLRLNSSANRMCICMDICAGLHYIHEKGMVHGDLKAANVVISSHGVAMITDFGNAQLKDLTLKFTNTASHSISVRWTAPELLEVEKSGSQVSKEADVYAYGMTVLEVLSGDIPYSGLGDFQVLRLVTINRGHPPRPEIGLDDNMWEVLTRCWARNPNERPRIANISIHLRSLHRDCTSRSRHSSPDSSHISDAQNDEDALSGQEPGLTYLASLHRPPALQIPGHLVEDREKAVQLKRYVADLCGVDNLRFIGSQPVSFGSQDLARLEREDYWVCEKSDGIRVLVLIVSFPSNDQEVYLIDRKNRYRQQDGLFFPHHADPRRALGSTLLDAELVMDYDPETKQETLNLLVSDCIIGDMQNLMSKPLTSRYGRLKEWAIKPYQTMLREHPSMREVQPFGIQEKAMQCSYDIEMVLSQTIPKLKHGNDGLLFTCAESGYVIGTDQRTLKWKPPSENSIDFKLMLRFPPLLGRPSEPEYTSKPVFQLLVWMGGDAYEHFDTMEVEDALWESWKASREQYDDRIVEVTWDKANQNWIWTRFRDDKEHGDHHSVVDNILGSIKDGVEADQLISHASTIRANWKEREKAAARDAHYLPYTGYSPPGQYGRTPPYSSPIDPAFLTGLRR